MIEKNKITRAEYLIFKYVEDLLLEIRALNSKNLDVYVNLPSHGLCKKELLNLLWQMFETGDLVAHKKTRGYFSPTFNEIEEALQESSDFADRLENTFYGYISAASERYYELKEVWENELI
jgi:hypothetical protein